MYGFFSFQTIKLNVEEKEMMNATLSKMLLVK